MRKPIPLEIPSHLVELAQLYAPSRHPLDAVSFILERHPHLIAELRDLRRRLADFDAESSAFDSRLDALQTACRAILDL